VASPSGSITITSPSANSGTIESPRTMSAKDSAPLHAPWSSSDAGAMGMVRRVCGCAVMAGSKGLEGDGFAGDSRGTQGEFGRLRERLGGRRRTRRRAQGPGPRTMPRPVVRRRPRVALAAGIQAKPSSASAHARHWVGEVMAVGPRGEPGERAGGRGVGGQRRIPRGSSPARIRGRTQERRGACPARSAARNRPPGRKASPVARPQRTREDVRGEGVRLVVADVEMQVAVIAGATGDR